MEPTARCTISLDAVSTGPRRGDTGVVEPAPTLRYNARRHERRAIAAAAVSLLALGPGAAHPLTIPQVVLGAVAVSVGIWKLVRQRSEQGWYALGVAVLLQLTVLAVWLVGARSFGQVVQALAVIGFLPGGPLLAAFVLADRARTQRRLAWGRDHEERRRARTYSRLTSATPVSAGDEWRSPNVRSTGTRTISRSWTVRRRVHRDTPASTRSHHRHRDWSGCPPPSQGPCHPTVWAPCTWCTEG